MTIWSFIKICPENSNRSMKRLSLKSFMKSKGQSRVKSCCCSRSWKQCKDWFWEGSQCCSYGNICAKKGKDKFGHEMEVGIFAKVHTERMVSSSRFGIPSRPLAKCSPHVCFRLLLQLPTVSDFIRILQTSLRIQPMEMTTRIPKQQRSDQFLDSNCLICRSAIWSPVTTNLLSLISVAELASPASYDWHLVYLFHYTFLRICFPDSNGRFQFGTQQLNRTHLVVKVSKQGFKTEKIGSEKTKILCNK